VAVREGGKKGRKVLRQTRNAKKEIEAETQNWTSMHVWERHVDGKFNISAYR